MALPSSESSTIGDHIIRRKTRRQQQQPISARTTDPIQNHCKSTISSLLLSTFSNNNNPENTHIRNSKKSLTLRGFGCTAQPEVTVPGVIRSSAHWGEERESSNNDNNGNNKTKKKQKKKKGKMTVDCSMRDDSVGVQDLWCGPGMGSDAAASVDCVNSARPVNSSRGKIDVNKSHHRERASYSSRQRVNLEHLASLDLDSAFEVPRFGADVFEDRLYHHLRNRTPDGLAEVVMFQNGLLMGRRSGGLDRYRDWRLDVDNMTYEELLELGDRIGHVSTGLGEDQIVRCLRKTKLSVLDEISPEPHNPLEVEGKCSICQEEFEAEDEMGKLECGHIFHLDCIKQWLGQKNACPVCKVEASSQ